MATDRNAGITCSRASRHSATTASRTSQKSHFGVVVVDEFHHAEAPTYRRILDHLKPRELLGLTATPERGDGLDVRLLFDGRTAAELRIWDAINQGLLSPFHYFGISDNTDLTRVTWSRGRYDEGELSRLYTGNDARAAIVIKEVRDKISALQRMRALGFCVSVDHAHYMADKFRQRGHSSRRHQWPRRRAPNELRP